MVQSAMFGQRESVQIGNHLAVVTAYSLGTFSACFQRAVIGITAWTGTLLEDGERRTSECIWKVCTQPSVIYNLTG